MKINYLGNAAITKYALDLTSGYIIGSVTDIEGIATQKLGLKIHFMNLQSCYGKGTLGMILPEDKMILCDKSLEPYGQDKETKEHILRFTIAHEVSHYTLHGKFMGDSESPFFYKNLQKHEKQRLETQANMLAAELLMPEVDFRRAYIHECNETKIPYELRSNLSRIFNVSKDATSYRIQALKL